MIQTKYDSNSQIITIVKVGVIKMDQAMKMLDVIIEKYGKMDTLYLLEDSSCCKYEVRANEIPKLVKAITKNMSLFKEVRHADMVTTPIETALSYIYAAHSKFVSNYAYKSFSTQKAAIAWLKQGRYYGVDFPK